MVLEDAHTDLAEVMVGSKVKKSNKKPKQATVDFSDATTSDDDAKNKEVVLMSVTGGLSICFMKLKSVGNAQVWLNRKCGCGHR
ncbi:hypothetical protein HPP92_012799 [Vanilla planifolia]|uniref:Uncharacterized protein n=1 Tax=Vanilla planifolia TaxID=51239 RepID=A0A835QXR4_VANPL|nr:hypothetical protein HPP92_012799 [Vanilla planifolia]